MSKIDEKNLIMEDLIRATEYLKIVEKRNPKNEIQEIDHKVDLEHAKFRISYLKKQLKEIK